MIARSRDQRLNSPKTLRASLILAAAMWVLPAAAVFPSIPEGKQQTRQPDKLATQKQEDESVQLHSDLVVVTVTATDASGHYAHGLTERDLAVLEDGASQRVSSFSTEETPFAAAVLIDMSGSMEYKFGLVRAAAASFVDHIRDDDQVAVYGFNNRVRQFQDFSNLRDISEYIWDAKAEDRTSMYDCMREAVDALAKRDEKRRAIVLISDGCDTSSSKASMGSVLKGALDAGVVIYAVDLIENTALIGGGAAAAELRRGRSEMKVFSDDTGGRYTHSPQGDKLEDAFNGIVDELRNQYTLTYYSTNHRRDGRWRKIEVRASRRGVVTRARKGYWAPKR